jgi:NADH-quinone oxidoreductase subunit D
MLRATGFPYDIRGVRPYDSYDEFNLQIVRENCSDSYSRYLIRIEEMFISIELINIITVQLLYGYSILTRFQRKFEMEGQISGYKTYTESNQFPQDIIYTGIEAPKGEFGLSLIGSKSIHPTRSKIRSPGYYHLQAFNCLTRGYQLPDVVTNIGTLDLVLGEIDR